MVVPGSARSASAIVYAPSPVDSHRVAAVSPARRVTSSIRFATMNAE